MSYNGAYNANGDTHRYRDDYPDKDYYDSRVTTLAFLRDAGIFGRFLTIF
jgi:hypothetical protein